LQLSLPVSLPDDETFVSFLDVDNEFTSSYLQQLLIGNNDLTNPLCYLFGARGVGKSHLLFACCHEANLADLQSVYLNMSELRGMPTEVIASIAEYDLVCIDNIHDIAGNKEWETALFDLINQALEKTHKPRVIIAGMASPLALDFTLPDLVSRLTWGAVFQLPTRNDEQLFNIIQFRLEHRGIEASEECIRFLLTRVDRELSNLMAIVNDLDTFSLQAKRKLTIPFIKQVLSL